MPLRRPSKLNLTKPVLTGRINIYTWKLDWRTLQAVSTSQVLRFVEWGWLCRQSILQFRFRLSFTCGARFLRFSALWNCSFWCHKWRQPSLWSRTPLPTAGSESMESPRNLQQHLNLDYKRSSHHLPSHPKEPLLPQTPEDLLNKTPKQNNSHQWFITLTGSSRQQPAASCQKR